MQQGKPGTPIVYYVFDLLEVDGEPLLDLPLDGAARAARGAARRRTATVQLSEAFDDGEALLDGREGAGPRGRDGQARGLALPRAGARATG